MAQRPLNPEPFYEKMADNIRDTGRSILSVGTDPPFSYTIGNSLRNLPELIVFGLGPTQAMDLLNCWSAKMIEQGREFADRELVDIGGRFPCKALICIPAVKAERTLQAGRFLGHEDYRVTQMLIPDPTGKYPGDFGCSSEYLMPTFGRAFDA